MAYATLNIGLDVAGETSVQIADQVFRTLRAVRWACDDNEISARLARSSTEQTLVVVLEEPLSAQAAIDLSLQLNQDCIAQLDSEGNGNLFGPCAEAWGPFDINEFITWEQAA